MVPLRNVGGMDTMMVFLMMMAGPLVAVVTTSMNAKRINAAWRERRAARMTSS